MLFIITPDDTEVPKISFLPQLDYTNFLELFWRPYFIILSGQTLIRFGGENIILTFTTYDKNTCYTDVGYGCKRLLILSTKLYFRLQSYIIHIEKSLKYIYTIIWLYTLSSLVLEALFYISI